MGRRDVLLGPHEQGIGSIGTISIGPDAPYGPHAPWPWRTHKIASRVTSHTHRNDGSPQEKDGPELGAELARR
jgi:hypothetical protein